MRVGFPWLCLSDGLLLGSIVRIEGIAMRVNELNIIVKLCYRRGKLGLKKKAGRVSTYPKS
jgi:hypothetical protein